ncbi:MAG: sensor histidine kinase [Oscillospiraceae bacterium]|nr:sensor histidine kinase [Oscillospiraceae bacterium]
MAQSKQKKVGRIKSSIVRQLNIRLFFRLLGIYICMDLLLLGLCAGGMFFWAEESCAEVNGLVRERGVPSAEATVWMQAGDYVVTALDREPVGYQASWLNGVLPEETADGYLSFQKGGDDWLLGLWGSHPGQGAALTIEFSGSPAYAVTLDMERPVTIAVYAARVLLICQLVSMIMNLFKNAGTIKKMLRPISELAAAAAKLNTVSGMSPEELQVLAGKLNEINATHLDARISVDGTQKELKDLAESINAMLERIDRSYRAQMRFVSDASHELRTPIAVIQGYANLLDRWGKTDPEAMQESIDAIRDEAESMKEMVEQLLFLARGDNDSVHVDMQTLDATAIATEVYRETEMIDETHPFAAFWEGSAPVYADESLLKQALRVLVDNAIKYTPPGGRIAIRVEHGQGLVRLSVSDEGQGIEAESLSHIFDRFYRTDESRARQTGGSGLGLSIAKWIVERHSGWLEVVSRVGVGTRITMVLPEWDGKTVS